MDYTIVAVEADVEELIKAVKFYMEEGWRPVGGIFAHEYNRTWLYLQSMVKKS